MVAARKQEKELDITHLKNRLWRLNNLYCIIDADGILVRFKLNAVQLALYMGLWYMNIVLKSRQHGVTTFFCILYLDACLFHPNIRAGIIAHNKDDAESFFEDKVKFAYDNLPESIKVMIPLKKSSARELAFINGSRMRVGTSMRSATLQYLHVSEYGKICAKFPEKAREIKTGALEAVHVGSQVSIESTAEGREGDFFDKCSIAQKASLQKKELSPLDFKFFFFAWHQDPRNQMLFSGKKAYESSTLDEYFRVLSLKGIRQTQAQKNWYAKKWEIQGNDIKREHPSTAEEAFEAHIEGTYFNTQFTRIYKEDRITFVPWEEGIQVDTWWDLGINDDTVIWYTQTVGHQVRLINYFANSGEGLAYYARKLREHSYEYGTHTGPHDLEVRELGTGITRREKALEFGIVFDVAPKLLEVDQIEAARTMLQRCVFDEKNCTDGIKALEGFRKEFDAKHGVYKNKSLHDWASHPTKAFITLAVSHHNLSTGGGIWTPKRS